MTIQQLAALIRGHNLDYRRGEPTISDIEYDKLVERLRDRAPNHPFFKTIEPVEVHTSRKVKLPVKMRSLDKCKTMMQLKRWIGTLMFPENTEVLIMPKFDGISMLYDEKTGASYSRGGSNNEGQDCTEHMEMCGLLGERSKASYVIGELVFSKNTWKTEFEGKTNPYSDKPYKSPRNTVAGFISRPRPVSALSFVDFYKYGMDETSVQQYSKYNELLDDLSATNHQKNLYIVKKLSDLTEDSVIELYHKWAREYYIDGLVVYVNNIADWSKVGRHHSTGNPKYAMAFKHADFVETFDTKVLGINWVISKSGAFKPTVSVEPVEINGCMVSNPTGNNARWLRAHKITKGATVQMVKSGDVIPKILSCTPTDDLQELAALERPIENCPICGNYVIYDTLNPDIVCSNMYCKGKMLAKLKHAFFTLGVFNIGEETITKLFELGFDTVGKILRLNRAALISTRAFGPSVIKNIMLNSEKILEGVALPKLMHASDCFDGIGINKAETILSDMGGAMYGAFVAQRLYLNVNYDEIRHLPKTEVAFRMGCERFYEWMDETGIPIETPAPTPTIDMAGKYAGFKVCFSGVRNQELEQKIKAGGGCVVSGISKNTTHLVVKDLTATTSKMEKAQSLNIEVSAIHEWL